MVCKIFRTLFQAGCRRKPFLNTKYIKDVKELRLSLAIVDHCEQVQNICTTVNPSIEVSQLPCEIVLHVSQTVHDISEHDNLDRFAEILWRGVSNIVYMFSDQKLDTNIAKQILDNPDPDKIMTTKSIKPKGVKFLYTVMVVISIKRMIGVLMIILRFNENAPLLEF